MYQHFESSYPEIQCLALNVVASIIERSKDEAIQSLFYETNGVEALLNFLKVRSFCFYERNELIFLLLHYQ